MASQFFLGVERSFSGRPWRARLDAAGEARALALAQSGDCDELLARVASRTPASPSGDSRRTISSFDAVAR